MKSIVVLSGPPGAGKGTHAPSIVTMLDVPHLCVGDMLREAVAAATPVFDLEATTPVGLEAKDVTESIDLVSDELLVSIIQERIREHDCETGFILEGFPRTLSQARKLDVLLAETGDKVTSVIELAVPEAVLRERIRGRWIHKSSGRAYHVEFMKPKSLKEGHTPTHETMLDDLTGEALCQCSDDTEQAFESRLATYRAGKTGIWRHYAHKYFSVNANQSPETARTDIQRILKLSQVDSKARSRREDCGIGGSDNEAAEDFDKSEDWPMMPYIHMLASLLPCSGRGTTSDDDLNDVPRITHRPQTVKPKTVTFAEDHTSDNQHGVADVSPEMDNIVALVNGWYIDVATNADDPDKILLSKCQNTPIKTAIVDGASIQRDVVRCDN